MTANTTSTQPSIDLRRYWDILVSRWRVLLVAALLGLALAAGYLFFAPSTYVATTTVSVFPITTDPYASNRNSGNLVDMNAESVTAASYKVAQLAADGASNSWDASSLHRAITTTVGVDSTTMTIAVSAPSEKRAREGAAAVAEAYLQARSDQAANSIDSVLDRDRERIGEHREQLSDAIHRLAAAEAGSSAAAEASADQQTLSLQISALLTRISALEGIDTTGGVILNPAAMTAVSVKPTRTLVLVTGLAAGLGLGIVAAFVTHSRRKRIAGPRDLSRELQLETFAVLSGAKPAADTPAIASLAQRVLHLATAERARVVALICDSEASWTPTVAEALRDEIRDSGVSCAVAQHPGDVEHLREQLLILPIAPDATAGQRLHALRISDVAVVIVSADLSTYSGVDAVLQNADDMGAPVGGAIVLGRASGRARAGDRRRRRGSGGMRRRSTY